MNQKLKTLDQWLGAETYLQDAEIFKQQREIVRKLRKCCDITKAAEAVVEGQKLPSVTVEMLNGYAVNNGYDVSFVIRDLELQSRGWRSTVTVNSNDKTFELDTVAHQNADDPRFYYDVYQLSRSLSALQRGLFSIAIYALVELYFDCEVFHQPNIKNIVFDAIPVLKRAGNPTMEAWDLILAEIEKMYHLYRLTHNHGPINRA